MSSNIACTWQSLPPRVKRGTKSNNNSNNNSNNSNNNSNSSNSSSSSNDNNQDNVKVDMEIIDNETSNNNKTKSSIDHQDNEERATKQRRVVAEYVQIRSDTVRCEATLEGKDGCAGEFYEYLDHTADVQCHSWGSNLTKAFENMIPCMFNYMTDLTTVEIDPIETIEFTVKGHDLQSLLFAYMDEFLFRFCTDSFCPVKVEIISFNRNNFEILLKAYGELFNQAKHPQGTEIKAITYSNMQIHEGEEKSDLYVIVDI
jgi:SHS2 domain-containing protein